MTESARSAAVEIHLIHESPTNPRTHFNEEKLAELAESILRFGVLQPILLRPRAAGGYELVAGHRRFRAARSIPLETIPAIIQELSDKEVLEIQIVENLQRADLQPLEEAEGYSKLIREHGYDADSLGIKIGKSRSYVYGRMKLADLCREAKDRVWSGALTHSVALLLARIPDEKVQRAAVKELDRYGDAGEPVSFRRAREVIEREFLCRLAEAKWKLDDPTLIAAAGPCTTCPFRLGNQPDFHGADDAKRADVCTNPTCFRSKGDAHWARVQDDAKARGDRVLAKADIPRVFDAGQYGRGLNHSSEYVSLDASAGDYGHWGVSIRKLLPKKFTPPITYGRHPRTREIYELVSKKDLTASLKAAGVKKPADAGGGSSYSQQQRAEAEKRKLARAAEAAVIAELQPKLRDLPLSTPTLRIFTKAVALGASYRVEEVFKRRALKWPGYAERGKAIVKFVDGLTDGEMVMIVAEIVLGFSNLEQRAPEEKALVRELAALVGVDAAAIEKRVRDAAVAKKKARADREKKKAAKTKGGGEKKAAATAAKRSSKPAATAAAARVRTKRPVAADDASADAPAGGAVEVPPVPGADVTAAVAGGLL